MKNRLLQFPQRYGAIKTHFNNCSTKPRRRDRRMADDEQRLHRTLKFYKKTGGITFFRRSAEIRLSIATRLGKK